MNAIPYIHLNEDEPYGEADCGCLLTHDDDGNPMLYLCRMHDAAPALVEALENLLREVDAHLDYHADQDMERRAEQARAALAQASVSSTATTA